MDLQNDSNTFVRSSERIEICNGHTVPRYPYKNEKEWENECACVCEREKEKREKEYINKCERARATGDGKGREGGNWKNETESTKE